MKVSKNQIQNVSFSSNKEDVKPPKKEQPVQGGEEKMEKSLACLAAQVPVVQKDSFAKQKANLEERLNVLNKSTALHREYLEKDDERFGSDGIKSILDAVDSVEKIDIVNGQLDILADTENPESKNVWAGTILALIDPEFEEEVENMKEEFPEVFAPTFIEPTTTEATSIEPSDLEPSLKSEAYEAYKQLVTRVYEFAFDETRMPVNNEDLERLIELANTEEKMAYVHSKLDDLDTDVVFKNSPHWAYNIAEWLQQDFPDEE